MYMIDCGLQIISMLIQYFNLGSYSVIIDDRWHTHTT